MKNKIQLGVMRGLLSRWLVAGSLGLACIASAASTNSPWLLRVWQSDEGLPNNYVTSLAQTPDGYVWVASSRHLARFDGVKFEEFSPRTLVPGRNQKITTLLRSRWGGLWFSMEQGPIVYLDAGEAKVFTKDLPRTAVRSLMEDPEGTLWICYYGGTTCRLKRSGEVKRFSTDDGLPAGSVSTMATDNQGRIWFSKGGQVGIFRNERFETLFTFENHKTRIAGAGSGGMWICSGFKLFRCDEQNKLHDLGEFAPEHAGAGPNLLLESRSGALWIGTSDSGLFRYDDSGFEKAPTSHLEILTLLQDREGNIWAGTGGGGLNYLARRHVELEAVETGLPSGTVQSLCEDTNGTLWAATDNGMLVSRTCGAWKSVSTNANWPGGTVTCVAADPFGAVWIGTEDHALHRWQNGSFASFRKLDGLAYRSIHALFASRTGDLWIAGETPGTLQRLRRGRFESVKLPPKTSRINAISEDAAGNIWVGSTRGTLVRIKDDQVIDETKLLAGGPKSIRCLYGTPDGILWIGYAGSGIGRLKDGKLARITFMHGLYDNHISQILADEGEWMWFAGDRGIFKVLKVTLADVAEGRDTGLQSIHYGKGEGLPSLQASFGFWPGAVRSRDGRLWIPTLNALAVANPHTIREDPNPPEVVVRRLIVDNQTVAAYGGVAPVRNALDLQKIRGPVRLDPGHQHIEFDYTALSFRAPANVLFCYKLEGFDHEWRWVRTERIASYSRLPAGNYRFRVLGCNGDGNWNETGASLAFTVTPFIWQTWWFRCLGVFGFTLAVAGIVRYVSFRRLRRKLLLLERQAALDKERTRIARDIHDDIGSRLTKIVMLSELTLQKPVTPDVAAQRAGEVAAAARQVMKSLDETVWAVNPRNDTVRDLIDYLGQFAVEFLEMAGIRCRVELPDDCADCSAPAEMRHNLFLASKEALNNVARHSQSTEAWLRVTNTPEELRIVIEDNGRGFDGEPARAEADGLQNMRQRLAEIGGQCRIESHCGAGTRISLLYPWPKNGKARGRAHANGNGNGHSHAHANGNGNGNGNGHANGNGT